MGLSDVLHLGITHLHLQQTHKEIIMKFIYLVPTGTFYTECTTLIEAKKLAREVGESKFSQFSKFCGLSWLWEFNGKKWVRK